MPTATHTGCELILGGQRSGKSRCAEQRAAAWLAAGAVAGAPRDALLIATATAGDAEMQERIARHRIDRAARVPALATLEVPHALAEAIGRHSDAQRLIVVDCLTLWLTNLLMPLAGEPLDDTALAAQQQALEDALAGSRGPVVLVSNEIGLGLAPMSPEARRFVDRLGHLHQRVAACCGSVTLMVAGIELTVKAVDR